MKVIGSLAKRVFGCIWLKKIYVLFTEEPVNFPPDLEQLIRLSISFEDNIELCYIPTAQEIKAIIFYIQSQKAPGPDGLPTLFYHRY